MTSQVEEPVNFPEDMNVNDGYPLEMNLRMLMLLRFLDAMRDADSSTNVGEENSQNAIIFPRINAGNVEAVQDISFTPVMKLDYGNFFG